MVVLCNSGKNNLWVQKGKHPKQPLTAPHSPHQGKARRRRPVSPSTTISHSLSPVSSWAGVLTWTKVFWGCEILLIDSDPTGSYVHMLDCNFAKPFTIYMLVFVVFFFPNRVTSCSHERCCVTISYIYIRWVQCSPVRADCVFCTLVRKRLLS